MTDKEIVEFLESGSWLSEHGGLDALTKKFEYVVSRFKELVEEIRLYEEWECRMRALVDKL